MEDALLKDRIYAPGVRFSGKEAAVNVWAPHAKKVELLIAERDICIPMEKGLYGWWTLYTPLLFRGDFYRIVIDEQKALPDPASLSQPGGVHGPSQAIDLQSFEWTDNGWKNPPLSAYVIYELHTGTFTEDGTFQGVIDRLDYLADLGITAIELMPVAQFPGTRNWGYDGVFPYAVQDSYGGAFSLMKLVDKCHEKGIAVILDVVYNHVGPEGNYLAESAPYFTDKYKTPWGQAINYDDAWCDGVRNFFINNALMWFRDFHIDALRLDATHAIKDFSNVHILKALKERTNELMQETGKKYYLIAESDLNDNRLVKEIDGGYGLDAQWSDEFHHSLRVATGLEPTGYFSDFDGVAHFAKSYKDAYVFDGAFSRHRSRFFGSKTLGIPSDKFIVFSQNHDQVGNRMLGERTSMLLPFDKQKLLAAAVLLSPFIPLLFMGEEWGAKQPFLYFVSHSDPKLIEAVRKGRKQEFAAFHAEGEAPDPQAPDTFRQTVLDWSTATGEPHYTLWKLYRHLIRLRKQYRSIASTPRDEMKVLLSEDATTVTVQRSRGSEQTILFLNFSDKEQVMVLPEAPVWHLLLDTSAVEWGGVCRPVTVQQANAVLMLAPASAIIYSNHVHS